MGSRVIIRSVEERQREAEALHASIVDQVQQLAAYHAIGMGVSWMAMLTAF